MRMDHALDSRTLGAFGGASSIFPLRLDGVPLEASDYPRRDFGPIGSKPKSNEGGMELAEVYNLMNTWVSDYCNEDGSLLHEQLRGSGAVPCLPKIPKLPEINIETGIIDQRPFYQHHCIHPSFRQQPDVSFHSETNTDNAHGVPFGWGLASPSEGKTSTDNARRVPFSWESESLREPKSSASQQVGASSHAETSSDNARKVPFGLESTGLGEHKNPSFYHAGASSHAEMSSDNARKVPFGWGSASSSEQYRNPSSQPNALSQAETGNIDTARRVPFGWGSASLSEDTDSLSSSASSSGYGTAPNSPNISPTAGGRFNVNNSTAYKDAIEFSQRFGYYGRLRNCLMHRPRKGKYFVKFSH